MAQPFKTSGCSRGACDGGVAVAVVLVINRLRLLRNICEKSTDFMSIVYKLASLVEAILSLLNKSS